MMQAKKRLIIAEDHAILREGLRALFEDSKDLEVVAEAADGLEAIRAVAIHQPDLILLDLSMPKMNGLEAIREIKRRCPQTKILVLTVHQTDLHINSTLKAGADGYAIKNAKYTELMRAIDLVLRGCRYVCPEMACRMEQPPGTGVGQPEAGGLSALTQREREVLKLIAEGHTTRQVAEYLFISPKTVDKHRSNLMSKLNLHNVQALTVYAVKNGLVASG